MKAARTIEEIKLEWQQHNREHGMSWNEVAELVNECANYARCKAVTDGEIHDAAKKYLKSMSNIPFGQDEYVVTDFESGAEWMREQQGEGATDWNKLREKYFEECCDDIPGGSMRKVNMAPHDLFEWFKSELMKGGAG